MITPLSGKSAAAPTSRPAQADRLKATDEPTRGTCFSSTLDNRRAQAAVTDAGQTDQADSHDVSAQPAQPGITANCAPPAQQASASATLAALLSKRLPGQFDADTEAASPLAATWMQALAMTTGKRTRPAAPAASDASETATPAKDAATLALVASLQLPVPVPVQMTVPAPVAHAAPAARGGAAVVADRIAAAANALAQPATQLENTSGERAARAAMLSLHTTGAEQAYDVGRRAVIANSLQDMTPGDTMQAMQPSPTTHADALQSGATATATPAAGAGSQRTDGANRLLDLLGQRLQFQNSQGVQHAVVRLEPYMAGSVRVEIRHEAGALQIHLSASRDDVVRQLQSASEGLRQELNSRQFTEVSVHVSQQRHDGGQGKQGQDERQEHTPPPPPNRALGGDADDNGYADITKALRRLADAETTNRQ